MPWIELKDGSKVTTQEDIPANVLDSVATGIEAGGPVPKGFTLEPPPSPSTEQAGARKTAGEHLQELGQSANSAVQTAREYVGPMLESARGKATRGVAIGTGVMQAAPAMMQHFAGEPTIPEAGENATDIAKRVVPQTTSELLTTLALGAASKITGIGGVISRVLATAGGDMAGKYLAGEEQNLKETALKTGITGALEVGGMLAPHVNQKILAVQKEAQGRRDTKALGAAFAKNTGLKDLNTPEAIAQSLAADKFYQTPLSDVVRGNMDTKEKALMGGVRQSMGTASPQNLRAATTILEKSADVAPKTNIPMGFRGPNTPVIQPQQLTPEQLVEMSIDRLRHIREEINHAVDAVQQTGTVGVSIGDLHEKYNDLKDIFLAGLSTLNPELKKAYLEMNAEYIRDLDLAQFLYKGKKTFTTGLHAAKLNTPAFGEYVANSVEGIRDKNLVADILKVTNRGGEFGAADQGWTLGPRVGGPRTQAGTVAESVPVHGVTPARPLHTTENMPPMGVYDIGALKGLDLVLPEEKRK